MDNRPATVRILPQLSQHKVDLIKPVLVRDAMPIGRVYGFSVVGKAFPHLRELGNILDLVTPGQVPQKFTDSVAHGKFSVRTVDDIPGGVLNHRDSVD
jgi:hypothetical protein